MNIRTTIRRAAFVMGMGAFGVTAYSGFESLATGQDNGQQSEQAPESSESDPLTFVIGSAVCSLVASGLAAVAYRGVHRIALDDMNNM